MSTSISPGQMVGHSMLLGFLAGALVGGGYGLLLLLAWSVLAILSGSPDVPTVTHLLAELPNGFLFVMFGGLFGVGIGASFGLACGFINGLVLSALTRFVFTPPGHPRGYRRRIILTSVLVTLMSGLLVIAWLDTFDYWMVGIPTLIALACAWWAGSETAAWYLAETHPG